MPNEPYSREDFYEAVHKHGAVVPALLNTTPKHVHGSDCGCANYRSLLSLGRPLSSSPSSSPAGKKGPLGRPATRAVTNGLRSPSDILNSPKRHHFTPYQIFGADSYAQAVSRKTAAAKPAFTSLHNGHNGRMIRKFHEDRQEREASKARTRTALVAPSVSAPAPEWRPTRKAFKFKTDSRSDYGKWTKNPRRRPKIDLSDAWDRNFTPQSKVAPLPSSRKPMSLNQQRKLVRKHVFHASATWKCSLEDLLRMENAVARVWKDPCIDIITADPGRFFSRRMNPDENRIMFIKSKEEIIELWRKLPRRWANLVPYCAFLKRYSLRFPPHAYIWIFKELGIKSVSMVCKILTHGLELYLPVRSAVCRLVLADVYFSEWNKYTPAFLCSAMDPVDFYAAISFKRFFTLEFQKCLRIRDLAFFICNTLKPDEQTLASDFSSTFSHFVKYFPKVCRLLESFKESTRRKIYSRAMNGAFTRWHFDLVKDTAPFPWVMSTPTMEMIPRYIVASWEYEKETRTIAPERREDMGDMEGKSQGIDV